MQNHQKIRLCISDSTGYCGLTKTDDLIGIGSRKNPNWGVDGIMEFLPGGKSMWKFQGSVKKELEFPVVFKKNSCACGICMGLGFWPWNLPICLGPLTQFCRISRWKIPEGFQKSTYILNPPCLDFSGNSPFDVIPFRAEQSKPDRAKPVSNDNVFDIFHLI